MPNNPTNNGEQAMFNVAEIQALVQQVASLTAQIKANTDDKADQEIEDGKLKVRGAKQRNVTVMFVEGKPVVGMANVGTEQTPVKVYEVPDPRDPTKRYLCVDLIVKNLETGALETIKKMNFLEFLQQGDRRNCPVIKTRGEEWVIEQGRTLKRELEGDKYRMKELDIEVNLDIEGTDNHYIVDIGGGKQVEIYQDYVNMTKSTPQATKQIIREVSN